MCPAVQVLAHQGAAMGLQAVPDHQQGLLDLGFERLEKFHDLVLLDAALVQPKHDAGARECGDDRDMAPVE